MKLFLILFIVLTLVGPLYTLFTGRIDFSADYRTANRDSAHLAPDPKTTPEAVIQVYAARAFNWRGLLATHVWIAVKPENSAEFTVYQIVGWRLYRGLPALVIEKDIPDRYWYGQKPAILLDLRGKEAAELIPRVDAAARSYPFPSKYVLWPGPNSNTLPAYIGRAVPELGLTLPVTAIGKDFLGGSAILARAPSGTGWQISLSGMLGILIARKEGIEMNLFGLVYGVRFSPPGILLPGIGALPGFVRHQESDHKRN